MCAVHATVRGFVQEIGTDGDAVIDFEAGLEHLSRAVPRHADRMLVVLEPYFRALEVGGRAAELGRELGIASVVAVANKIRDQEDADLVREFCEARALPLAAVLPLDPSVREAERAGIPLIDRHPDSPFVRAVLALARGWTGSATV